MCGRYTLSTKDFSEHYGVEQGAFEFSSYNIAPTQNVPVVLEHGGERVVEVAQWGLLPSWTLLANSSRSLSFGESHLLSAKNLHGCIGSRANLFICFPFTK